MNELDCWEKAYGLQSAGRIDEAVSICKSEPCATNSIDCQRYLGWYYYSSDLLDEAYQWFIKASDQSDVESEYGVASVYFKKMDYGNALKFYTRTLNKNYYRSCYWLGYIYEKGLGVEKDRNKAINFLKIGAENGYLICDRSLIYLEYKKANVLKKIIGKFKLLAIMMRAFFIANRNLNDDRLADINSKQIRKHVRSI